MTFPASVTQTIAGTWTAKGVSGALLSLRSSTTGTQWKIDPQGTRTISYLDVKDSNNTNATAITVTGFNITNSGNNTGWNFNAAPTVSTLGPPSLVDGTTGTGNTPNFNFDLADSDSGDTIKYQIQIDDTSDFSSVVVDYTSALGAATTALFTVGQAAGSGTYTTGQAGQTLSNASYYWRVRAIDNSDAQSSYSTANSGAVAFVISSSAGGGVSGGGASSESLSSPVEPQGEFGITINNGDAQTASKKITVIAVGGPNTTHLYISEDPQFPFGSRREYNQSLSQNSIEFELSDGEGTKIVYARFCHQWELCSNVVFDSIIYKPAPIAKTTEELPGGLVNGIKKIPKVIEEVIEKVIEIIKPEKKKEAEIPLEEILPKETPYVFRKGNILPVEPTRKFVLAPLPRDLQFFARKFPEVEKTLKEVGVSKITDVSKLQSTELSLPALTESAGIRESEITAKKFAIPRIPLAQLDTRAKQKIPNEVIFARTANELIDINVKLLLNKEGNTQQKISTIAGKQLELVVKPEKPVKKIKGYIIFKKKISRPSGFKRDSNRFAASLFFPNPVFAKNRQEPKEAEFIFKEFEVPLKYFAASILFPNPVFSKEQAKPIETDFVLEKFEYEDLDNDGIYTANIKAPLVEGEYEIITVMDYQDEDLLPKEIRLITVVDPEGYVYRMLGNEELRVVGAVVTLFWLNPETKKYELWPAGKYLQENPVVTDKTGKYSFLSPEGFYYLTVEAPNYINYQSDAFKLKESVGIHMNIEMKRRNWLIFFDWKVLGIIILGLLILYNFYKDRIRERLIKRSISLF